MEWDFSWSSSPSDLITGRPRCCEPGPYLRQLQHRKFTNNPRLHRPRTIVHRCLRLSLHRRFGAPHAVDEGNEEVGVLA